MDQSDSYKQAGAKADLAPSPGRVRAPQRIQPEGFSATRSLDLKEIHLPRLPFLIKLRNPERERGKDASR